MNYPALLNQAVLTIPSKDRPDPNSVVEALLAVEKNAKKDKPNYRLEQLLGTWRLSFITGTKKARKRAGIVLGKGSYLPNLITIQLSYQATDVTKGYVENSVQMGKLKFSLTGPVKFLSPQNILGFDFTHLTITMFNLKIYDGKIRGGHLKEDSFYQERIAKQAFFTYFLVTDKIIAARGRGGGLALWQKVSA